MIDVVYRHCGQKETVIFCDRIMGLGFSYACRAGISFGKDDMVIPETKDAIVQKTSDLVREYEQQYNDGLITRGEKYNKVVDTWTECTEQVAKEMMKRISAVQRDAEDRPREADQLHLYDVAFRCARLAGADEAACRHARPDDQAVGRDHRDADHLQLQGGAVGARVLQLDPRRPQGSGRHRVEDGELGLSDPPSGRRGAGLHRHRGGLRHDRRHHRPRPDRVGRGHGVARRARARPHRGRERQEPGHRQGDRQGRRADGGGGGRGHRGGAGARDPHPLGADLRDPQRHLRQVLRARSRPRHAGQSSARRSASSPRSRSASPARSSPCAPSIWAAWRAPRSSISRPSSRISTAR